MRSWILWMCVGLCVACGTPPVPSGPDSGNPADAGTNSDAGDLPDAGEQPDAGTSCSAPTAHGPRYPGTVRNVALEAAWAEDTRVLAADGSLARVELNGEGTRVLRLSGFSIALPAGTTITGATVRVTGRTPTAATGLTAMVRFGRTTFAQTSPERTGVAFTTSSEVHALFGPGVRWSGSLTRNLAMVSNFAMDLGFQGPAATVLEVDHVTLELLYREGTVDKTTGPLSPTVVTQASLARQWLSTDSALTVDGDPALVDAMVDHELTARLESSGYGFELPDDAAVVGIRVDVTRGSLNSEGVRDLDLRLLKNGAPTGLSRALVEEDAVWASGYETVSYGGEGDLWGQAWTIADLEAPGFGNGLRAQYPTPSGNDWAQVDAIGITVFTCP
ncbi:hypothetical protein ATI61_104463 [Archangium gephyra]|uniref:Lipoprotein n=1 Tax=Archangium gephyra TaxID=48 RepID=A0ABX9K4V9_9BACT|nr:hypothetical protein ATI61_104463 [Archangium gephyra]